MPTDNKVDDEDEEEEEDGGSEDGSDDEIEYVTHVETSDVWTSF